MPVLVVIPARLGSTRLPRKLLQPLGGVPLVVRVAERLQSFGLADRLIVATDADAIETVVAAAGFEVARTSPAHPSGTDRVWEVAARPGFDEYDAIVNAQGDSPFLPYGAVAGALAMLGRGFDLGTAAVPLAGWERDDLSRVKVAIAPEGRALAFSRSPLASAPWRHLGVYAFTRDALRRITRSEPDPAERALGLEQLRALALGLSIGVAMLGEDAGPSVDTPADLEKARTHWTLMHEAVS